MLDVAGSIFRQIWPPIHFLSPYPALIARSLKLEGQLHLETYARDRLASRQLHYQTVSQPTSDLSFTPDNLILKGPGPGLYLRFDNLHF